MVANRLRPKLGDLVSKNQSAFVRGRCLHDNFVLVRQVVRKINVRRQKGVLIKLDISRAFDSISWAFLFEVLRKMGFSELFLRWLGILLSTATTKIIVNGVPGESIRHVRGLRQGDPTSPMLFVMGMEALTKVVVKAVEVGLFQSLAAISPLQRVSVYADDVVLFVRPEEQELRAIREILDLFGEASGSHVNYRKSTATLIRGDEVDEERVSSVLRCRMDHFPIKYLGLQLVLRPLTRAEWLPILDSAIQFMPAWQRGMIARQGRLVLIKSVIAAKPIHHLLVAKAPLWLIEELEKWQRAFFWAGKQEVHGGQCLVAWETVCKPTSYDGLEVKDLRLQGLAMRVRWAWLSRTDPTRPWAGLSMMKDTEAEGVFHSLARIVVGDGRKVFFWRDRWIQGRMAEEIAPEVFEAVSTRRKNSRRVADAMHANAWMLDVQGELNAAGYRQWVTLWLAIAGVQRNEQA